MAAPKGTIPPNAGKGRRAGSVNKATADIKAMVLAALDKAGGEEYLTRQAHENPVAFLGLLSKIMPLQVNGSANVLLIEQLCVVANQEWQAERKKLQAQRTIEGEASDVSDEEAGKPMKPQVH